jgi:hypothetical protein
MHCDAHDGGRTIVVALEPSVVFGVLDGHVEQQKNLALKGPSGVEIEGNSNFIC